MSGPLTGVRVIEIGCLGPGPFGAMMLADMGAEVIRLERGGTPGLAQGAWNVTNRGRPSAAVDLKAPGAVALVLELAELADAVIEGFRPGVMERLGLGPETLLERNPRLVYARATGYGQDGTLAAEAGHDVNYISIAGVLGAFRRDGGTPMFPLNLLGDYGGGGMLLAFGLVCGILEARASGKGQVVDAAMVDGVALLSAVIHAFRSTGEWSDEPGTNMLDSGAHFYEVYATLDARHIAVGAIEPQFYSRLLEVLGIPEEEMPQHDRGRWPEFKRRIASVVATRTRDEWAAAFESVDACATPVLSLEEAPDHPHNVERKTFIEVDGQRQPAPAPRFSRTPGAVRMSPDEPGGHTDEALAEWGVDADRRAVLRAEGAIE